MAERSAIWLGLASLVAVVPVAAGSDVAPLAPVEPPRAAPVGIPAATSGAVGAVPAAAGRPARALDAVPPPVPGPRTARGRAWPAVGQVTAGFGDDLGGLPSPGVRIAVDAMAKVHAPAAGEVVFADVVPQVGLVLIIAHGDEYHSVLAGLAALAADVGDQVVAGREIGRMRPEDGHPSMLHLEIHHRGQPVDPLPWLGVGDAGDRQS